MSILQTPFTCPNGHKFSANAKLRARCPECGSQARREFEQHKTAHTDPTPIEPKHKVKSPVLLRAGKPRQQTRKPVVSVEPPKPEPPKPEPVVRKPRVAAKTTGRVSNGLVRTSQVKGKITPTIRGRPKRTSVSKVTQAGAIRKKPYWHEVAEKFAKLR